MVAYSSTNDLLTGNVPTPVSLDPQKFVDDAANEIDSKIGFIYETPVDMSLTSPVSRPAMLLIQRISNFLASGRLLLAASAGQEDSQVHAYGWQLVKDATASLDAIAKGEIPLDGAPKLPVADQKVTAPLISNKDAESNVDAFYDRIANPNYQYLGVPVPGGYVL